MRLDVYQKERLENDLRHSTRPFKLDVKDRFLMILVYYRLFILLTHIIDGFLFDLDQSNIYRDIQKIESW